MTTDNLETLCRHVCNLCRKTGIFLKNEMDRFSFNAVELKGVHDFVSYVDREAERRIVESLAEMIPDAGFITEENTLNLSGRKFEWIIDPLDGTTNFIHGVPCYAISIALREDEIIVLGVIYEINLDECFYTWQGAPSFLNFKEIKVSSKSKLDESLIATGFPNRNYEFMEPYMALLNELMFCTHGIRRLGSAAVDLAYVACGRFEAFYEYHLSPWDVAAGALIVQNAGGKVTDFKNGDNYLFGREIIASNSLVHDELTFKLQSYFNHKIHDKN